WVLHERHVTDFDGTFAEWEVVSSEREHAAEVRAAEEEALRRVQEKKKTSRRDDASREERSRLRVAQQRVADLETQIEQIERRIDDVSRELEDPALYTRVDGVSRAKELGAQLDTLRPSLERALDEWGTATEALDTLGSGRA